MYGKLNYIFIKHRGPICVQIDRPKFPTLYFWHQQMIVFHHRKCGGLIQNIAHHNVQPSVA